MAQKFKLAPGTQVREEDFGLLFYTQAGPRLYFLPSDDLLDHRFFNGDASLDQWLSEQGRDASSSVSDAKIKSLGKALGQLLEKGVLIGL